MNCLILRGGDSVLKISVGFSPVGGEKYTADLSSSDLIE